MNYNTKEVGVNDINAGDTIMLYGDMKTVCKKDISRGGFCGTSIFGNSFKGGREKVKKVIIHKSENSYLIN